MELPHFVFLVTHDGHLGCFHLLGIMSKAMMDVSMQISFQVSAFSSLGSIPQVGLPDPMASQFTFLKKCQRTEDFSVSGKNEDFQWWFSNDGFWVEMFHSLTREVSLSRRGPLAESRWRSFRITIGFLAGSRLVGGQIQEQKDQWESYYKNLGFDWDGCSRGRESGLVLDIYWR